MLKVFKTFVATVALSQKIILLLDEVPSLQLSPSLSHWNIGKLGEEESCSGLRVVGGITNRFFPSFFLFFLFLQRRYVFQIKEGDAGKKQMYLSRAAPRAEDEGTLPVLSSSHQPTIVSPTTPSHSSHSLETQQNWKFQESLSWVVSFWWLVSKTIFPQRLSWVSGAPALHYSPELPVSPGQGGGYDRGGWSWRKEGVKIRWAVSR